MQLLTMTDTSANLFFEGSPSEANSMPLCFLDQTVADDRISCEQCPLGAYGLTEQSMECYSCAYLNGELLEPHFLDKLKFLCDNKVGQISSDNRGLYELGEYPTKN